jgi:hypothetical protein
MGVHTGFNYCSYMTPIVMVKEEAPVSIHAQGKVGTGDRGGGQGCGMGPGKD